MKRKNTSRNSIKSGKPPGTLTHIGNRKMESSIVKYFLYDNNECIAENIKEYSFPKIEEGKVLWLDIEGIHEIELIEAIGKQYDLHPLVLEDILNTNQRPKIEQYDNYAYVVLKDISLLDNLPDTEQISFVIGKGIIITFKEKNSSVFASIEDRITSNVGKVRKEGADYLFYAMLDAMVDKYFDISEYFEDKIDELEDSLIAKPVSGIVKDIYNQKKQILFFYKSVWPIREIITVITRGDLDLFSQSTLIFIRDIFDHIYQITDMIETQRELIFSLLDMYHSSNSNKMNEIMKVLTIISTIFIPLTFIAGIYGMNFNYMPELNWKYGYISVWVFIITISIGMLIYFKRKKWW